MDCLQGSQGEELSASSKPEDFQLFCLIATLHDEKSPTKESHTVKELANLHQLERCLVHLLPVWHPGSVHKASNTSGGLLNALHHLY